MIVTKLSLHFGIIRLEFALENSTKDDDDDDMCFIERNVSRYYLHGLENSVNDYCLRTFQLNFA